MSLHLGIDPDAVEQSVYDLMVDEGCDASKAVTRIDDNLDAIAAETDLAAAESELASNPHRNELLRNRLSMPSCRPTMQS